MTSNRGQNVSILQHPESWEPSITAFADTGTSLRSANPPRNNSLRNRKGANGELKKCSSSLITNSVSSTSILNPISRELSPVRWCDREVDGVYLGRSGWVQVQHRSLDDTQVYEINSGISTLPSRKHFSELNSTRSVDRRERTRPVNLPIKKRTNRENRERPCKFIQELGSFSPPSITPIISPPPAFKDHGLDVEFSRRSSRKTFFPKEYEPSPSPSPDRQNILSSVWTSSVPRSSLKNHRPLYQSSQAKSLEDERSDRIRHKKRLECSPLFTFRSLDNDIKTFEDAEKRRFNELEQKENNEVAMNSTFRQRNQRDGRRDLGKSYRTRSSSESSNSSTTESSSNEKNADLDRNGKFYVKRSRSLQLSEKRSPCELMNRSSGGKSCDPLMPERPAQFPQNLHHMLVTVDGESIPVFSAYNQSLSKIAPSEVEQKKLIREAEKEARIISEFLNGTRSRAAARNLLMHRYFNQSEEYPENLKTRECVRYNEHKNCNRGFYQPRQQATVYNRVPEIAILYENPPIRRNPEQTLYRFDNKNRWDSKQLPRNDVHKQASGSQYSSMSSSSSSSSFSDVFQSETKKSSLYENSNSRTRPGSAPESDDCASMGIDHRSLSLPRSFLSERPRINNRDLFWWKQQGMETPGEVNSEGAAGLQGSRTAPATPIRDIRYDRSQDTLDEIECIGSSETSLLEDISLLKPLGVKQKGKLGCPGVNLNEKSGFLTCKKPAKIPDSSSEKVLQKVPAGLTSSLEILGNGYEFQQQSLGLTKAQVRDKKALKNEKYDSHDSGIQMGNRGNVESSESQDTDFQEDFDSPLAVRRRDIRATDNFCRPQSEVFNQILIDKFKADLQWRNKREKNNGKGVRRTNSDLGGQRLYNWDLKNHNRRYFNCSSVRDKHTEAGMRCSGDQDSATVGRSLKPRLRRSLSQPLGLNELPPFVRRRSSTLKCFALSEDEKHPRGRNSEDELLSDSESSVASLSERKKSFEFAQRDETVILAEAVWDHVAIESCELPFRAGDVIEVLNTRDRDWWWGATSKNIGYFPSAFVRLRVSQEDTVEDYLAAVAKGKHASAQLRKGKSVSLLSNDQVRSSIVRELLNTERDFVKILRDVKDGYIVQCRRRSDMFTPAQITAIFSNLEDLLIFQEKFLNDLEARVDQAFPHKSCIGEVFLNHGSGFRMYSEYCNSHPLAIATLQDLYQKNNYCKFFETCRLKQNLIEIPLDGYLLTPVQRICKYPLQLAELLKYTKTDHLDFRKVEEALETMRSVANLINERKRKMESLEKLAAWQQRVEGWEGEDLIEISSQLIHQGDVVRITSGMWTSNVTLFLFDHQIVYCKKDLLKRNVYIYKGRIYLDSSVVVDVPDGKNQQLGVTVKYGLQISNSLNDKWLLFCCRSSEDKVKWLQALTEERKIVAQDKEVGLDLPPTARQLAKMIAKTKKCPPCKPRVKNKPGTNREAVSFRDSNPDSPKTKPSRRVGTWFTFGGVMKGSKVSFRPRAPPHQVT